MDKPYLRDESVSRNTLTRRQAITTASAAAILPATASAAIVDPHPAWLDEWRVLDQCHDNGADLWDAMRSLSTKICQTAPTTHQGLVAQLLFMVEEALLFDGTVDPETAKSVIMNARSVVA